jgi:hypothetical protein
MTDATKASILLGALALAVVIAGAFGVHQARAKAAALHRAAIAEGETHAAQQSETQAKADRATALQLVAQRDAEVARLRAQAAAHPSPKPAEPVPPDAPITTVVAGLQSLGLHPQGLGEGLAMSLPDGRTILIWGRESLRVPGLTSRIGALETLSDAQAQQVEAQRQQQVAADRALAMADSRADLEHRRAEALQRAITLTPRLRSKSAGVIYSMEPNGSRHIGAIVTRAWGPIEAGALYLNNQAGVFAAYRF